MDQAGRPRLSPVEVTFARLALGAAVLFAVMLARRQPVPRSVPLWGHIAVAALFSNTVPYLRLSRNAMDWVVAGCSGAGV